MDRKTPYRHPVKQHYRDGVLVHHYERGKGKKPMETRPVIGSTSMGGARWRVTREGHSVTVSATDIVQGMSRGIDVLPIAGQSVTIQKI